MNEHDVDGMLIRRCIDNGDYLEHYRFQCAEVADMKASAGNKSAVVRWRFDEGQSSRSARLPFIEAERRHDSQCESSDLNPGVAEQISILINFNQSASRWLSGLRRARTSHFNTSTLLYHETK